MRALIAALLLGFAFLGVVPAASAADEQLLVDRTPGIDLPAEVTDVTYIVFRTNDDNLNDTVAALRGAGAPRPHLGGG